MQKDRRREQPAISPHPLMELRVTHFRNLGSSAAEKYADALAVNGGRFLTDGPLAHAMAREVRKLQMSEVGVVREAGLNGEFKINRGQENGS